MLAILKACIRIVFMRVLEIKDTRESDLQGNKIKGSGILNNCKVCGKLHEIHVKVSHENDDFIVGLSCAKKAGVTPREITRFKKSYIHIEDIDYLSFSFYSSEKNGYYIRAIKLKNGKRIESNILVKTEKLDSDKDVYSFLLKSFSETNKIKNG